MHWNRLNSPLGGHWNLQEDYLTNIDYLTHREAGKKVEEIRDNCLHTYGGCSITEVADVLRQKNLGNIQLELFSTYINEKLAIKSGGYLIWLVKQKFPNRKNQTVTLDIPKINYRLSADAIASEVADMIQEIIAWLPEYKNLRKSIELRINQEKMTIKIGITFLKAIADEILTPKGYEYTLYNNRQKATISICVEDGIITDISIDLLKDFHSRIREILHGL